MRFLLERIIRPHPEAPAQQTSNDEGRAHYGSRMLSISRVVPMRTASESSAPPSPTVSSSIPINALVDSSYRSFLDPEVGRQKQRALKYTAFTTAYTAIAAYQFRGGGREAHCGYVVPVR